MSFTSCFLTFLSSTKISCWKPLDKVASNPMPDQMVGLPEKDAHEHFYEIQQDGENSEESEKTTSRAARLSFMLHSLPAKFGSRHLDAAEARKRSRMIDQQIQADALLRREEFHVLMTSPSNIHDARMLVLRLFVVLSTHNSSRAPPLSVEQIRENILSEVGELLSPRDISEIGGEMQSIAVKIWEEFQSDYSNLTSRLAPSIGLLCSEPTFRAKWIEKGRFQAYNDLYTIDP